MSGKNIIRVVRGLLALLLFVFAAQEVAASGLTLGSALAGGIGVILLLGAIAGKG